MIRALDQLDAVPLSGVTAGRTPFFSPDSRWIGFFERGDLKKVAVTGEPVITLSRNLGSPEGGTWGDDGTIVFSSEDGSVGLMRVSADGGEATALTKTGATQNGHYSPSMLPGGRGVLFTIWANTPDERQLAVFDLKSGQQKTLLRGGVAVGYVRQRASCLRNGRLSRPRSRVRNAQGCRVRSRSPGLTGGAGPHQRDPAIGHAVRGQLCHFAHRYARLPASQG